MNKRLILFTLLAVTLSSTITIKNAGSAAKIDEIEYAADIPDSNINKPATSLFDGLNIYNIPLNADGDCSLIKFGDTEVLIDAGGIESSRGRILEALNEHVNDKIIEYIIFTHADSDHICNLATSLKNGGGVASWIRNNNVPNAKNPRFFIDFDLTQDKNLDANFTNELFKNDKGEYKGTYKAYCEARTELSTFYGYTYYPASSIYTLPSNPENKKEEEVKPRPPKTIKLFKNPAKPDKNDKDFATLTFLDNPCFYKNEHDIHGSARENNIAVCTKLEYKGVGALLTGDIEEYDSAQNYKRIYGETDLIAKNPDDFDNIVYYKAAHHGSETSNSLTMLNKIRPQYIAVPCLFGDSNAANTSHKFPRQSALTNMLKFTDRIYFTSKRIHDDDSKKDLDIDYYGKIRFNVNTDGKCLFTSSLINNETESVYNNKFYNSNRQVSFKLYNLSGNGIVNSISECSYIKMGHIDILINPGFHSYRCATKELMDKVKYLCNDKVLDYLILSNGQQCSVRTLSETKGVYEGLFNDPYFKEITNVYYPGNGWKSKDGPYQNFVSSLDIAKSKSKVVNIFKEFDIYSSSERPILDIKFEDSKIESLNDVNITFLKSDVLSTSYDSRRNLYFLFNFNGFRYLNVGSNIELKYLYDPENNDNLYDNNIKLLKDKVSVFQVPISNGDYDKGSVEQADSHLHEFIKHVLPLNQIQDPNKPSLALKTYVFINGLWGTQKDNKIDIPATYWTIGSPINPLHIDRPNSVYCSHILDTNSIGGKLTNISNEMGDLELHITFEPAISNCYNREERRNLRFTKGSYDYSSLNSSEELIDSYSERSLISLTK